MACVSIAREMHDQGSLIFTTADAAPNDLTRARFINYARASALLKRPLFKWLVGPGRVPKFVVFIALPQCGILFKRYLLFFVKTLNKRARNASNLK